MYNICRSGRCFYIIMMRVHYLLMFFPGKRKYKFGGYYFLICNLVKLYNVNLISIINVFLEYVGGGWR